MSDTLDSLCTPALVLDRPILERNLAAMRNRMRDHGVTLRPHLKTTKSLEIARRAADGGGVTVSTLREAEYFAAGGLRDLTYAVAIDPRKLERVARLIRDGATCGVLVDDPAVAGRVASRGEELGVTFDVLVEIDCGAARGGVTPEDPVLVETARAVHESGGSRLAGVLTHAGQSYDCDGPERIADAAEAERAAVVAAADRLREAGLPCATVSAGSTPTAVFARSLAGVTEMRPGNYMFFDLYQHGLGVCRVEDIAVSVLATVISHAPSRNTLLVDAGSLALSMDTSASRFGGLSGYGRVCALSGEPLDGVRLVRLHQEHGFVEVGSAGLARYPLGSRLRILPNHACATAAMHARYAVVDGGDRVADVWERTGGW